MQQIKHAFVLSFAGALMASQAAASSVITCTGPDATDVRKIEVVKESDANLPCTTLYTKHGATSEIASARYTEGYCDSVGRNVATNLEAASFTCVAEAQLEPIAPGLAQEESTEMPMSEEIGVAEEVEAE